MLEHEHTGPVDNFTWTFSRIAMWAPALIVLIIFYEVILRYIFLSPTLWVNEASLWLGGFIYVSAGLYAMQQRSHIRIFIIYDVVPLWLRRVFDIISTICVFFFAFWLIWGGYDEAVVKFFRWERFGTAFDPPIPATNKPLILITLALLSLQATSNLVRDWPSKAWVRKAFDIASTILILMFAAYVLPVLIDMSVDGPKLPMIWRIVFVVLLFTAVLLVIVGLFRDFHKAPKPFVDDSDPSSELDLDLISSSQTQQEKSKA